MIDSRAKGARIELQARDKLRELTGLSWERVPASGALNEKHGLKGDLYVPNTNNIYCVEVKGRKDPILNHKILNSAKSDLEKFWDQAQSQALKVNKFPILIFKWDRSKFYVAYAKKPDYVFYPWVHINAIDNDFFVSYLEDFIKYEKIEWIT